MATGDERVRIESTDDGVRIALPGPRSRFALPGLALLAPIVAYVALGNAIVIRSALAASALQPAGPAAAIWGISLGLLLLADVPVLTALVVLAYHVAGSEVVWATPWMLVDERRLFGVFRYRRAWAVLRLSDLRLSPQSGGRMDDRLLGRRGVLFVVDGRRVRAIAEGCTPEEAAGVFATVDEAIHRPTITR